MTTSCPRRFPLLFASLFGFALTATLVVVENVVDSDRGWIPLLVYAPQHVFAVLPGILALISLGKRRASCALINAVSLLLWAQWLLGWNVPLERLRPFTSAPPGFRIMTYNVQRGEHGVPALMQIIRAQNPDILCLQESQDPPPKHFSFPGDAFEVSLPNWNFARGGDVMTLSRFPLVSRRLWPLSGGRRVLETVWQTPQGAVRVLNIHISKSDAEKTLQNRDFAAFARQGATNARIGAQTRFEQWPALETAISGDQTLPLVMAGDFNSPARGRFYRALASRLSSAWKQGGWGMGASFPSRWPLVDIDHIFLRDARASRAFVPPSRASDHLPLVADVSLEGL